MKLAAVDNTLRLCEEHLTRTGTKGTEAEDLLTKYLLVVICREFEQEIRRLVLERVRLTKDPHIIAFIERTIKFYRMLKVKDLKGNLLGKFSDEHVSRFEQKISEFQRDMGSGDILSDYGSVLTYRDTVAHGGSIFYMNLDELNRYYVNSLKVIEAFGDALNTPIPPPS